MYTHFFAEAHTIPTTNNSSTCEILEKPIIFPPANNKCVFGYYAVYWEKCIFEALRALHAFRANITPSAYSKKKEGTIFTMYCKKGPAFLSE